MAQDNKSLVVFSAQDLAKEDYDGVRRVYGGIRITQHQFKYLLQRLNATMVVPDAIVPKNPTLDDVISNAKDLLPAGFIAQALESFVNDDEHHKLSHPIKDIASQLEQMLYSLHSRIDADNYESVEVIPYNASHSVKYWTRSSKKGGRMTVQAFYGTPQSESAKEKFDESLFEVRVDTKCERNIRPQLHHPEWDVMWIGWYAITYPVSLLATIGARLMGTERDPSGEYHKKTVEDMTLHPIRLVKYNLKNLCRIYDHPAEQIHISDGKVKNISIERFIENLSASYDLNKEQSSKVRFALEHLADTVLIDHKAAKSFIQEMDVKPKLKY